jgi:hypothetical protein
MEAPICIDNWDKGSSIGISPYYRKEVNMTRALHSQGFITTALALASFLGMAALTSTASTVVVPNGLDAREGTGSSGILNRAGREQTVYASTNFPNGPVSIQELRFRPNVADYMPGTAFSATIWDVQIVLSTTSVQPGGLSPTFNDNTGPDAQPVVSGAVTLFSTFTGPDGGPKEFDIIIPLNHPFTYDPAQGNLLVDIQNSSGDATSPVDAEYSSNGAASRVVSGSPISSSGVPDYDGDVLQIVYSQLLVTNPLSTGPTILVQPTNEISSIGQTAVFTVVAEGAAPLTYQWVFDGTNTLVGATNSSLSLSDVQSNEAGLYEVRVSNNIGSTNSIGVTLTVTPFVVPGYIAAVLRSECTDAPPPPPQVGEIATGPDYVIITVGYGDPGDWQNAQQIASDAVFESIMPLYCALPKMGCVTDSVQWNVMTYDANGNPNTSGCAASGCQDRSCAGFESGPPIIVGQPGNQSVNSGQSATFGVNASGAAPLNYQWMFDGTNAVAGGTNAVLVLPDAQTSQAGTYTVEVSNFLGMTNSLPATLTVNPGPAATNGYITAVLRSGCTSAPSPPPPVGATTIGPDYVIMTVADASPTNFAYAQQIVTDAVFESLMPLYCALPENSGVGCVTNQVQWNIMTYDTNGNPLISGCAASGCGLHGCGEGGAVTPIPALGIAPSTNNIGLYWPADASDYILEGSSNLANWYPIDPAVKTNGGHVTAQMPMPGQGLFYRLRHK